VALSSDGNTALVGIEYNQGSGTVGQAWVFARTGSAWAQQGPKLTPSDDVGAEGFGTSVAISGDGNTALIGGGGLAWVFTRSGSTWTQQGPELTPNDEIGFTAFGHSVALSDDGNTALIGATTNNNGDGAAWVFTRSGSTWAQQGPKLIADDEPDQSAFGWSVALSADGNTALIGGYLDSNKLGAAWVFTRSGSTWTQQGPKLTPSNWPYSMAWFGGSVALSADGNTALIGDRPNHSTNGAAWVFIRSGSTWTQQGPALTASDADREAAFGWSVALSADGNTALIGGPDDREYKGSAWEFARSGSTWAQQGSKLTPRDETNVTPGPSTGAGASVALSDNGNTGLIGGPGDNGVLGATWVFVNPTRPPTVTAVAPTVGPAGGGNTVTIRGTNFEPGASVEFDNTASASVSVPYDGKLTAVVPTFFPPHNPGTVDVTVTTSNGTSAVSDADHYTFADYHVTVLSTPDLLAYWRLGERSGTKADDELEVHNGTYYGGYALGAAGALIGDPNAAVSLDGSTGRVRLPSLGSESNWTIEGWTKLTKQASASPYGNNPLYAGSRGVRLIIRPSGFYADDGSNRNIDGKMQGGTPSNVNQWVYWALERNGSTLTLYRDTVEIAHSTLTSGGASNLNGAIGSENGTQYFLHGSVDELAIYEDALAPTTLTQHYNVAGYS
jgi:hypothetical protein